MFAALALLVRVAVADPVDGTQPAPAGNSFMTAMAPLLVRWIESSRDAALEHGVEKIPKSIRSDLEGYVPAATLDRVRWRSGGGGDWSLQQGAFLFKDAQAITLDYVIGSRTRRKRVTTQSSGRTSSDT
jgi:hypothetical protein